MWIFVTADVITIQSRVNDGYRALIIKDGASVKVRSRNDKDLIYPAVATAGRRVHAERAVIDGEIVAVDKQGRPSFQALQHRATHPDHTIAFYAFDLLHLNGEDTTRMPLEARRAKLAHVIQKSGLLLSLELPGEAANIVSTVRGMQLEGVVAKRKSSPYEPGERSNNWQKLKLERQQEFVIGGYRPATDRSVDALVVGYFDDGGLRLLQKYELGWCHTSGENSRENSTSFGSINVLSLTCRQRVHPVGAGA